MADLGVERGVLRPARRGIATVAALTAAAFTAVAALAVAGVVGRPVARLLAGAVDRAGDVVADRPAVVPVVGAGGGGADDADEGGAAAQGAGAEGAGDAPSGGGQPDDDESGSDAVAGTWTGTVTTAEVRESALVGAGYTASGDMWFTVDEEGRIEGRAIVVYQPTVDLGGLNGALGTIKSLGTAAVGAFPGVFGIMPFIVEGLTTDIVAVRGTHSLPAYTVDREITGTYTEGLGMSLEWASDPALEMPITFFLDGVGTQEQIHQAVLAAEHPWSADAQASETAGVRLVTAQDTAEEGSTADGGVRTARSVTWFAERS